MLVHQHYRPRATAPGTPLTHPGGSSLSPGSPLAFRRDSPGRARLGRSLVATRIRHEPESKADRPRRDLGGRI